jgi:hypothetical protein
MAAASTKRITLAELRRRAKKGDLSAAEVRTWFAEDEEHSGAFAPAIRLNYGSVDTGGEELSPNEAAELFLQATEAPKDRRRRGALAARQAMKPTRAATVARAVGKVLTEGDSWFNLPDLLGGYPKDCVDILRRTHNLRNIALWRAEIEKMVAEKQYLQPLKAGTFRHFLFSGGGNDVLGSIEDYVIPRNAGDINPANAPNYVNADFAIKVRRIIRLYETLSDDVRGATRSSVTLYVHGYANAIPVEGGEYLGGPLEAKGFDPQTVGPLARGESPSASLNRRSENVFALVIVIAELELGNIERKVFLADVVNQMGPASSLCDNAASNCGMVI